MARALQRVESMDDLETTLREYEVAVRSYVKESPLTAVTAAFALGYVLGGGLTPRLSWIAISAAARMVMLNAVRDMALRPAHQRASATTH